MDDFNEGLVLPSLIGQLKSILESYPDDGQILKELIQNAEDAGATRVVFLIDHSTYGTDPTQLYDGNLAQYQAAEKALYAAHFAKDSNYKFKANEDRLPKDFEIPELNQAVDELQKLLHDSAYLRYPNKHLFPMTPHDVIDQQISSKAIELATAILDMCREYIERHVL